MSGGVSEAEAEAGAGLKWRTTSACFRGEREGDRNILFDAECGLELGDGAHGLERGVHVAGVSKATHKRKHRRARLAGRRRYALAQANGLRELC